MVRWLVRIAILLIVLALLGAGTVTWELHTDTPRDMVVDEIQTSTGLRLTIGSMTTSWSGQSTLHDVAIRLPTGDEPIFAADQLAVRHTGVLRLLFGAAAQVHVITASGPVHVTIAQGADGRWNIERLVDLLSASTSGGGATALPRIEIDGLALDVRDRAGRRETVTPIKFTLDPLGPGAGEIALSGPGELNVAGRFSTTGDMTHELTVKATDAAKVMGLWLSDDLKPASVDAKWSGHVSGPEVLGELTVTEARAGAKRLSGAMSMAMRSGSVTINPRRVTIENGDGAAATLEGGELVIDMKHVETHQLFVTAGDTRAKLTGQYAWGTRSGAVHAAWSGAVKAMDLAHHGETDVRIESGGLDGWRITAEAQGAARTPRGQWTGGATLSATGENPRAMTWSITSDKSNWTDASGASTPIQGAAAHGRINGSKIEVTELAAQSPAPLRASGEYDMDSGQWHADAAVKQLDAGEVGVIDASAAAHGDAKTLALDRFDARGEKFTAEGSGAYTFGADKPMTLAVKISGEYAANDTTSASYAWEGDIGGAVGGKAKLDATGVLTIERLSVSGQKVDDISTGLEVSLDEGVVAAKTGKFDLLGGSASVSGKYVLNEQSAGLNIAAEDVSLGKLSMWVNGDLKLGGAASGKLRVRLPRGQVTQASVSGSWSVKDFSDGAIAFETMTGELRTERGVLRLDPVRLTRGAGEAAGWATFDLHDGRTLHAELKPANWPVESEAITAAVSGDVVIDADVVEPRVGGNMTLDAAVSMSGEAMGRVKLSGVLADERLVLSTIDADLAFGRIRGAATIDGRDWTQSTGVLSGTGLKPGAAAKWWPEAAMIDGAAEMQIKFSPSTDPRAPGPMHIDARWSPTQAMAIRHVPIGGGTLTAFASMQRAIIDEASWSMADGKVKAWASLRRRDGQWYDHVRMDFENLDLNVLNASLSDDEKDAVPGRLEGTINLLGPTQSLAAMVGTADVTIRDSSLRHTDIIGGVLGIMGKGEMDPVGSGRASMRLEGGTLWIDKLRYENRGTEILLDGRIDDIASGMKGTVKMNAIGSLQPFKNVTLPMMRDVDALLKGLASQVTTVRITGPLDKVTVESTSLREMMQTAQKLLTTPNL
ncbi:MAG: hypothetical protein GC162_19370 [Planctomycetes bacterium]|nr:hypothetical protein [Planctomycetota bacterium]